MGILSTCRPPSAKRPTVLTSVRIATNTSRNRKYPAVLTNVSIRRGDRRVGNVVYHDVNIHKAIRLNRYIAQF